MNSRDANFVPDYAKHTPDFIGGFFGPYRFLSNFYPSVVEYKGLTFQSVEAAYQAAKSKTPEDFVSLDPSQAKRLGKITYLRNDWEEVKKSIMGYLVFQKFDRHQDLRKRLLETERTNLEESNNWGDSVWGISYKKVGLVWEKDPNGKNNLGLILQKVRRVLK